MESGSSDCRIGYWTALTSMIVNCNATVNIDAIHRQWLACEKIKHSELEAGYDYDAKYKETLPAVQRAWCGRLRHCTTTVAFHWFAPLPTLTPPPPPPPQPPHSSPMFPSLPVTLNPFSSQNLISKSAFLVLYLTTQQTCEVLLTFKTFDQIDEGTRSEHPNDNNKNKDKTISEISVAPR